MLTSAEPLAMIDVSVALRDAKSKGALVKHPPNKLPPVKLAEASTEKVRIATAGWAVPRAVAGEFAGKGTALERYAARLSAVEINSTFYRSHRPSTYARWASTTPAGFQFSVKLPKQISHEARLVDAEDLIAKFCEETSALGEKRGPVLVQLPPSLRIERTRAHARVSIILALQSLGENRGRFVQLGCPTWIQVVSGPGRIASEFLV